jgi:hypothetical protein
MLLWDPHVSAVLLDLEDRSAGSILIDRPPNGIDAGDLKTPNEILLTPPPKQPHQVRGMPATTKA